MIKNTKRTKTGNLKPLKPATAKAPTPIPAPARVEVAKPANEPLALMKVEAPKAAVSAPAPLLAKTKSIGKVSVELVKPEAKKVAVAGSFNQWKPELSPLRPAGNGRWVGDLAVGPGRHEYLFVVDGKWMPDPNAKESVENPFGGRNSVLNVAA